MQSEKSPFDWYNIGNVKADFVDEIWFESRNQIVAQVQNIIFNLKCYCELCAFQGFHQNIEEKLIKEDELLEKIKNLKSQGERATLNASRSMSNKRDGNPDTHNLKGCGKRVLDFLCGQYCPCCKTAHYCGELCKGENIKNE